MGLVKETFSLVRNNLYSQNKKVFFTSSPKCKIVECYRPVKFFSLFGEGTGSRWSFKQMNK